MAVTRRAGKAFSTPKRVSRGGAGDEVAYLTVAIDEAGAAVAAWQRHRSDADRTVIQAAVLSRDGRFSKPLVLSSARTRTAFGAAVAASGAGKAIVSWTEDTKSGEVVRAATRTGAGFSAAVRLSADGQDVGFSNVALNAAGDAIVAWSRGPRERRIVQTVLRPAGGHFARPINLTAAEQRTGGVGVAIDPGGSAIAAWSSSNGANLIVRAAVRRAGGTFSIAVDVSERGRDGVGATPYVTANGDAVVVWIREDIFSLRPNGVAQMATRSSDGAFSQPINLSPENSGAEYLSVTMNSSRATIAAWSRATNDEILSVAGVQVATRTPEGSVSAPVSLVPTRRLVSGPSTALDQSGNAVVVWARYRRAGEGGGPIQAAVSQHAPHR